MIPVDIVYNLKINQFECYCNIYEIRHPTLYFISLQYFKYFKYLKYLKYQISNIKYKMTKPKKHSSQSQPNPPTTSSTKTTQQSTSDSKQSFSQTTTQKIFFALNTLFSTIVTYFAICSVCNKEYNFVLLHRRASTDQILTWFSVIVSLIIFVHAFCADWLQIVFNKTQNDLYRANKNVISNNVLWGFIFMSAYLFDPFGTRVRDLQIENGLIEIYLIGRVLFSAGYIVGAIIGHQSFRALGFGFTFGSTVLMIAQASGHSVMHYFQTATPL